MRITPLSLNIADLKSPLISLWVLRLKSSRIFKEFDVIRLNIPSRGTCLIDLMLV